jgi:hypothetical protein
MDIIEKFNLYRESHPNLSQCWIAYLGLKKRHYGAKATSDGEAHYGANATSDGEAHYGATATSDGEAHYLGEAHYADERTLAQCGFVLESLKNGCADWNQKDIISILLYKQSLKTSSYNL